jgi:hypothetical protein
VQKVILYIQPQLRNTTTTQDFVRVDLMEEELIELTQVIQDARDIEKIFTDYSVGLLIYQQVKLITRFLSIGTILT